MKARTERRRLLTNAGYDPITDAPMHVDPSHPCERPCQRVSKGDPSSGSCPITADGLVAPDSAPALDEPLARASNASGSTGGRVAGRIGRWLRKVHRAISRWCPSRREVCQHASVDNVVIRNLCDGEVMSASSQGRATVSLEAEANFTGSNGGAEAGEETDEDPWQEWECLLDPSVSYTPRIAPLALFSKERCDLKLKEVMDEYADPAEESTSASDGEGSTFWLDVLPLP